MYINAVLALPTVLIMILLLVPFQRRGVPNVPHQVRYEGMFGTDEGVSVLYTTYYNKLEEDIFIEKPTDIRSFSIVITVPGIYRTN